MSDRPEIMPNLKPRSVVALVYDELCTFEFGIVAEVFGLKRPEVGPEWYTFKSVAVEHGPLMAAGGLTFTPTGTLEDFETAETIIIPGWRGKDEPVPKSTIKALQEAHARGARLVTICSGVYVLATAGLLTDATVTTHWRYVEDFKQKFPNIQIEPDSLYVEDGTILTSAGSSAGIDLCLHIVRQDFGAKIANSVARRLVMHAHRQGGQTQYIEQPLPRHHEADRLSATLEHIQIHISKPHSISTLAKQAGMSTRTFQRRFSAFTGLPIAQWVTQERLTKARDLLETTQATLDDISETVGFKTAETLRYHFRKKFNISPGQYRARFQTVSSSS